MYAYELEICFCPYSDRKKIRGVNYVKNALINYYWGKHNLEKHFPAVLFTDILEERIINGKKIDNPFIIYEKSNDLGLSLNRNFGLQFATGDIIGFPDDDCTYYPDTLENILNCFLDVKFKNNDAVLGQIFDNHTHQPIIKSWPQKNTKVTIFNFYKLSSSITLFCKKNKMKFNESMGAGTKFGSCEDTDYIYNMLVLKKKLIYCPSVKVWHPEINYNEASLKRVESYASGLGYFIANEINFLKVGLLLGCILKKGKQAIISQSCYRTGYFRNYFKGLIRGLQQKKIN